MPLLYFCQSSAQIAYLNHVLESSNPTKYQYAESLFKTGVLHTDPSALCDHPSQTSVPDQSLVRPVVKFIRALIRASLDEDYPRYEITLAGRKFLVGRYIFVASGMIGRGTRGYVALEWTSQRFTFLKDTWRIESNNMEREGDIMVELFEAGVEYVSDIICHSDVRSSGDESMDNSCEFSAYSLLSRPCLMNCRKRPRDNNKRAHS